ncbi:MAG: hypothetical protein Q9227_007507 [Pyrenula ochraceoflavens]
MERGTSELGQSSKQAIRARKIPHPESTNFYADPDFPAPPPKRIKRFDSTNSSKDSDTEHEGNSHYCDSDQAQRAYKHEIPDSEEEEEEEEEDDDDALNISTGSQTELENVLPPVKTDREAIEEYEAYSAAETEALYQSDQLKRRGWQRGRSSIYVDAFNLALDTVLEEESHLFNEAELAVFAYWRSLSYESQYLYVRLFLRKTSAWHRINRLGYYSDVADLNSANAALQLERELPCPVTTKLETPGEAEAPVGTELGQTFQFAQCSEQEIKSLEEASSLLLLDELKSFAKDARVQGKTKKDLLGALRATSGKQTGLGFRNMKRSDTEESMNLQDPKISPLETRMGGEDQSNRDAHFTRKILDHTGSCVRLSLAPLKLFERVHLVFYRSTEWTEKSLTTIILAKISRRNFPMYVVSRSGNIFPSRALLLEFEASLRVQFKVDSILEFNGTPGRLEFQQVKDIMEEVYPRWKALLIEEQRKEERIYESGEGAYLRRFSPAWVYTRIIHKGLHSLGRFKEHKREHGILIELLNQKFFHHARRGAWYQRKALLEEHYMHALTANEGRTEEAQKKRWKKIALRTCETGLEDRDCHVIYHHDLQKRIRKLEKKLKIPVREQHDFGALSLVEPVERTVDGARIEKPANTSRPGSRRGSELGAGSRRGNRTVWVDSREGGGECSVEAMCLSWYRNNGWKGYHCEGGILRTLFAYLFYEILFTYVPNVFQTEYQTCPLDLFTDSFYPSRASEINHRLMEISNGAASRIISEIHAQHNENRTCCIGLDWDFELADLLEIVECFNGESLATICKVMAQEYQQRGGGIPDLFLWHPERRQVMFSEVKSENDRLSDTQRLWIHVLTGAGIRVELCHAVAKEVLTLQT